jgi:hypothetical protein
MKRVMRRLKNEDGVVLGVSLIMLGIFTVLGISSIIFTTTELQIASNEQFHKMAFYGAEAGRGYVPNNIQLYGVDNITEDYGLYFPNTANADEKQALNSNQAFNGDVTYIGGIEPPRGSGFEVTTFRAHRYRMTCNGYGPRNSVSQVESGFYRIGF